MNVRTQFALTLLVCTGCGTEPGAETDSASQTSTDSDSNSISDSSQTTAGTDPALTDTDPAATQTSDTTQTSESESESESQTDSDSDSSDSDSTDSDSDSTDSNTTSDSDATSDSNSDSDSDSDSTDSDSDSESDSDTDNCPPGQEACPCDGDACDEGLTCIDGICTAIAPGCGNGVVDMNEDCDDGQNGNQDDGCTDACEFPACGDGFLQQGEACDEGAGNSNDAACTLACEDAYCGDQYVYNGVEECDDGNNSNTDACVGSCEAASCGDGYVYNGSEACDDGNNSNTDACVAGCVAASCGDGYVQSGVEECDDGNNNNADECNNNCQVPSQEEDACGFIQDGPWIEISYKGRQGYPATSPNWFYSDTPGWGEPEWAPAGESWPYIHALGNILVENANIGGAAIIDSNDRLRLFLGLEELISYDYATVCLTGYSYSVGSSVTMDVFNAVNDCGAQVMVSNGWFPYPTDIDFANCMITGNGLQAIEVDPWGGSSAFAMQTMRLTLHGANY